jgi:hypothetical protein
MSTLRCARSHGYAKQAAADGFSRVRGLNVQLATVSTPLAGRIFARADSAYYGWAFVATAIRKNAWFSVTARMTSSVVAAITSIGEDAWQAHRLPPKRPSTRPSSAGSPTLSPEVPFSAFTGRRKAEHVDCRLIMRRVKRLQPLASDGSEQAELFATYPHHAFITNSTLGLVEADERHRYHAIVEQVIAELRDGLQAHLPSGKYAANAAWVSPWR